ncbi:protein rolling stone-like [Sitodiplosis mosellana]|uniref:protein rolling stone-like n=1 Tax=Sitodiplosis mosellana TaxID=263140 RepID=UPI00244492F5|nr:protein rolling stone-like [Sitodiplosis mosellana]
MVNQVFKKELRLHNCGFSHDPVDSLMRSQWQSTSKNVFYLIYRWLVAIFVVAVVGIALEAHLRKYTMGTFFVYLTRWGITTNMIVGVYGAVLVTIWHFHTDYQERILKNKRMPTSFKIYWALHNIALVTSFVITIVYWSVLHVNKKRVDLPNILSHAMNSVIMFIDILIVAYPMRLYHVIQPLCFGVCFGVFSYIYHLCGGVNQHGAHFIYPVLNWAKPGKALITVTSVLLLVIIMHMILFCVYKLRVSTQRRLYRTASLPKDESQTFSSSSLDSYL